MFSFHFFTSHVLILAAFWVPLKVQFITCTSSTVSKAPFFPRLPMLHTITNRERETNMIRKLNLKLNVLWLIDFCLFFISMKENGKPTHLIPWPGPHATPEMVIFDDPALIAIQSSPNGTEANANQLNFVPPLRSN